MLLGQNRGETTRKTLAASLQFAPNSALEFTLDYFYAGFDNVTGGDVNVILNNTCPDVDADVNSAFPGTDIAQVFKVGCYGLTSMQARQAFEDTHQIAPALNWEVSDRLTLSAQGNYTTSEQRSDAAIVDAQYNYNAGGAVITMNPYGDGGVSVDQAGDPQLGTDHYLGQWYDFITPGKGHEYSGRIDLNYDVSSSGFLRSLEVGYRYNDRYAEASRAGTGVNCASTNGPGGGLNGGTDPYNEIRQFAVNSEACTAYRAESLPQPYSGQGAITQVGGISYADLGQNAYHRTQGEFFGGKYGTVGWVNLDQGLDSRQSRGSPRPVRL